MSVFEHNRGGVHHVGILAPDLEPFRALARWLQVEPEAALCSEVHDAEFLMMDVGGTILEVIRPLSPHGPAGEQLAAGAGGAHHFAVPVADAQAALDELRAAGFETLDNRPRAGLHNTRIGFAHVGPALLEVVEPAPSSVATNLVWQHRTYHLHPDKIDEFCSFWRGEVVPLREQLGFVVAGGWLDEDTATFIWIVGHPAPEGWDAAERAYYQSPLRAALQDPRQFVAAFETRLLRRL